MRDRTSVTSSPRSMPYYVVTETELTLLLLLGNLASLMAGIGGVLLGFAMVLTMSILAGASWAGFEKVHLYVIASLLGALGIASGAVSGSLVLRGQRVIDRVKAESRTP